MEWGKRGWFSAPLASMGAGREVGKELLPYQTNDGVLLAVVALWLLRRPLKDPKKMEQFEFEQGIGFSPFAGTGNGVFKALRKDEAHGAMLMSPRSTDILCETGPIFAFAGEAIWKSM